MSSRADDRNTPPRALWVAGGLALCGWLLIAWFFYWAAQHDGGDGVDSPYPIELIHGVLGGLVLASLLIAWWTRRTRSFRVVHVFPLALAAGYAGTVLYFGVLSLS